VLARLARVFLLVALLTGWQAALDHAIEHVGDAHEESTLCGALDGLTACASQAQASFVGFQADYESPLYPSSAPRVAQAPPFLSQGPPSERV
jgi:hypothetical protein